MEGYSYNHNSILEKYDNAPTTNSKKLVNSGDLKNYIDSADNLVDAKVDNMIDRVGNPFVFKGTVASLSNLPSSANTVNDTYFVEAEGFMYTWNGTSFDKSSTDVNNQLAHDIATEYDEQKADYKAGQLVLYNNQVYVRKADAIASEGAFISSNWTPTSLGDELYGRVADLKSALENTNENIIGRNEFWKNIVLTKGKIIDDSGAETVSSGSSYTNQIPLESNLYYIVYTKGSSTGTFRVHGYKNGIWVKMLLKKTEVGTVKNYFVIDNSEIDSVVVSYYYLNTSIDTLTDHDPDISIEEEIHAIQEDVGSLATISESVTHKIENVYPEWNIGGINAANGNTTTTSYQVRNSWYIHSKEGLIITIDDPENFNFRVAKYDSESLSSFNSVYPTNYGNIGANEIIRVWMSRTDHVDPISPEQYGVHLSIKRKIEVINNIDNSRYDHSPYKCKSSDFTEWYHCLVGDEDFATYGFGRNISYSDTIALYDNLVDNVYVNKNLLTTLQITGMGEIPIYEYIFKPLIYTGQLLTQKGESLYKATPKFLLDGSMHGFERGSTFGNFLFLNDLVNNWDQNECLRKIRTSCEIRCIPISNPYGFENNTYSNENNVNINRNFPSSTWKYEEPGAQGSGSVAGDQPETQMLMKWVWDNYDALIYLCMHTNGQYYASSYAEMNACLYPSDDFGDNYTHRIYNVINRQIEKQTVMWANEFTEVNPGSGRCGQYQPTSTNTKGGTVDTWALENASVNAMTLEGINGLKLSGDTDQNPTIRLFSKTAMCINAEITGNFILNLLYEYC